MACGLRRCSGKRGCICPRARSSLASVGSVVASPLATPHVVATEEHRDAKATPEDVTQLFRSFDMDGNGMIDRKELTDVLSSLDSTYWTMKRIRALFRAADLDRDQFISWQEFCRWVFARGEEQQIVRRAGPVLEARKVAIQELRSTHEAELVASETIPTLAAALQSAEAALAPFFGVDELQEHRQRLEMMHAEAEKAAIRELRSTHEATLVASENVHTLAAALKSAEAALAPFFGMDELQEHRQRLEKMQLPFEIVVMTVAGGEFRMEVTRQQSVASLCQDFAKLVDKKAYRILLAHETGPLKPPMSTLEECGVKGPMQIGAQFGEVDPLLELPFSEFLALLVEHKLASHGEIEVWQQECSNGKTSEDDVRFAFKYKLKSRLDEAMAERRRKAEEEEKQRKVLEGRRFAILDPQRAELEPLTFDNLLARALKAQIVREGEAVPEDHRESLLQQLALAFAVKVCEAKQIVLDDQIRNVENDYHRLAGEVQPIKDQAQTIFDEWVPEMDLVRTELSCLDMKEKMELRTMTRHPDPIAKTLQIVAAMCELEHWQYFPKQYLGHNFPDVLSKYDKDNAPVGLIQKMKRYIDDETCNETDIGKISKVGAILRRWVQVMYNYHFVAKKVEPYKIAWTQISAELENAESQLSRHRQEQREIIEDLQHFQQKLALLQERKT